MSTFTGILLLIAALWFWLDSARAREIAIGVCEASCRQHGLQFLDQTVALVRFGIRWTGRGIRIRRLFRFDFSEEGVGRLNGHITLVGIELEELSLGLPSASIVPLRRENHQQTLH
ncbi:MAG: DUF3301 domain-containing protein [Gammaproteobacteria bacterium]|nr:DUF3301 domain-containing protein [Gammaproteobacteria bacterium]MCP5417371.1 DUF3301 domain-containing protein [Chromatiaceae bacterium]